MTPRNRHQVGFFDFGFARAAFRRTTPKPSSPRRSIVSVPGSGIDYTTANDAYIESPVRPDKNPDTPVLIGRPRIASLSAI